MRLKEEIHFNDRIFKIVEQRGDWLKIGIFFFFFKSLVRSFLEELKISIDVYEGKKNRADS